MTPAPPPAARTARFRAEYGAHRASEGRDYSRADLMALPYLATGPLARQWSVRARSYDALVREVLAPMAAGCGAPLRILDLGAGNGWLCRRAALAGHRAVALDLRDDHVDGLGAAAAYLESGPSLFHRVAASFDAIPLRARSFDVAIFNASLHYALDLAGVLREAARATRSGGRLVVLDSPFYDAEADGTAMVAEKRATATERFGDRAEALLALPFVEFLTRERLEAASDGLGLRWRRHRVRYPLWYELRPLAARLRRRRVPSRFDLWESSVP
ncbi:MAG TPA: class I SAM-dependent methyltransferase [Longimicrobiaceae bacterium]|nr:class I SAM-dependent methyltransferase [Longimicrobiaceae bacterium]